jgi:hypothetical protein
MSESLWDGEGVILKLKFMIPCSFGVFYLNQSMPFGGVKASGHGRFGM